MKKSIINIAKPVLKMFRESNELKINGVEHRLTRAEKLVYIAYSSKICKYDAEEKGFTVAISNSEIALIAGVDVTTVINVKKQLEKINLIQVEYINKFSHRVKIVGYENIAKTLDEGGQGYVKIPYNLFNALCKLNSNELRIAFDLMVAIDTNKDKIKNKGKFVIRYFNNAKKYLPSYINCSKKVRDIFNNLKKIFNIRFQDDFCACKNNSLFDCETFETRAMKGYRKAIMKFAKNTNIQCSNKDLDDLVGLSMEYGIKDISTAFMRIFIYQIENIENLGGLVRTIIKNNFKYELM